MEKHELMILTAQDVWLTWQEICEICHISLETLNDLIAYGIIHPERKTQGQWQFNLNELHRVKTALRLKRDLEINLSAVALIMELLDEVKELREQSRLLDKYFWYR